MVVNGTNSFASIIASTATPAAPFNSNKNQMLFDLTRVVSEIKDKKNPQVAPLEIDPSLE
jgi:hypothetical protein